MIVKKDMTKLLGQDNTMSSLLSSQDRQTHLILPDIGKKFKLRHKVFSVI